MHTQVLGIVGGIGPLATVDFLSKLLTLTPASRDSDHLPWLVISLPQTPDRSRAILQGEESPYPCLLNAVERLNAELVSAIVILCNTAHHWYDALQQHSKAPILHIADAAIAALSTCAPNTIVGILATRGTIYSGFYQRKLEAAGFAPFILEDIHQRSVDECIRLVKANQVAEAARHLRRALDLSAQMRCHTYIMACTEIPVAHNALSTQKNGLVIDANLELAKVCVNHFMKRKLNVLASHPA